MYYYIVIYRVNIFLYRTYTNTQPLHTALGTHCETDHDDCSTEHSGVCLNGATCTDLVANFSCDCPSGYEGVRCAVELDECSSSPCSNGATCGDLVDGFECRCLEGYQG